MKSLETMIAGICLIATSSWVLIHILWLTLYGSVTIYENSKLVLVGDWAFIMAIFLFGLYFTIKVVQHRLKEMKLNNKLNDKTHVELAGVD